jgi:hypothetical protein
MNYTELVTSIQTYTENQFPDVYIADGQTVSFADQLNRIIEQAEQKIYNVIQFPSLRKNVTGIVSSTNPYLTSPTDFLSVYSLAVIDSLGNYTYLLNKDVNFIREAYPNPTSSGLPKYYALFGPTVTSGSILNELSLIMGPTPDQNYNTELHYYYYPDSIVQAPIASLGAITGGSSYSSGTFYDVPLTGGSGSGAMATIKVVSGVVTTVIVTVGGSQYVVGDILTASLNGGSGFSVLVGTVTNPGGTSWLGDNFDTVLLYGCLVEAYTFMKGEADMIGLYDKKYNEALQLAKRLGDGLERQDAYRSGQYRQPVT